MSNIAIHMPNWIGDFVLALSVVTRKAGESGDVITLIVPEHLCGLCRTLSTFPIIEYKRKKRTEIIESADIIKQNSFVKLYILPHSFSSAWFGFRTGIYSRRGVSAEQRGAFLTETVPSDCVAKTDHQTREYSEVLETKYEAPSSWPGLSLDIHQEYAGSVVLCPGSADSSRRWTGYDQLIKLWPEQRFILLGDARDKEFAREVGRRLPHRVINLTGETSLEETVQILAGASVVISNDSGLMHIAGFIGAPVVGIFGATSPEKRRPLGPNVKVHIPEVTCSPCYQRGCYMDNYLCMATITPEQVQRSAKEIMR